MSRKYTYEGKQYTMKELAEVVPQSEPRGLVRGREISPQIQQEMNFNPYVRKAMSIYMSGDATYSEALEMVIFAQAESLEAFKKDLMAVHNRPFYILKDGEIG